MPSLKPSAQRTRHVEPKPQSQTSALHDPCSSASRAEAHETWISKGNDVIAACAIGPESALRLSAQRERLRMSRDLLSLFGSPAVFGCEPFRPVALRPRLSTGLPLDKTAGPGGAGTRRNLRRFMRRSVHPPSVSAVPPDSILVGHRRHEACRCDGVSARGRAQLTEELARAQNVSVQRHCLRFDAVRIPTRPRSRLASVPRSGNEPVFSAPLVMRARLRQAVSP